MRKSLVATNNKPAVAGDGQEALLRGGRDFLTAREVIVFDRLFISKARKALASSYGWAKALCCSVAARVRQQFGEPNSGGFYRVHQCGLPPTVSADDSISSGLLAGCNWTDRLSRPR